MNSTLCTARVNTGSIMPDRRAEIRAKVMGNVVIDPETGCWNWQGSDSGDGRGGKYPRMSLNGQTVAVHRVMFTNEHGYIPGKKQLDHVCRNRRCVNPHEDHLEMVTHLENQKRKGKRGDRSKLSLTNH